MPEVRAERTGWRDEGLSQEHRKWGFDCPAFEYDTECASALVEYKNEHAKIQYPSYPREWVKLLYKIRGREIDDDFLRSII